MRSRALALALVMLAPALAGCTDTGPGPSVQNPIEPCGRLDQSFEPANEYNPRVQFDTTNGTFQVVLYGHQVPFTAGHFLRIAEQDKYDDTRFHRLVPSQFVIGGDPRSRSEDREAWGTGGYNYKVIDEYHQFLRHDQAGIMSMVSPQPNSVGSQFIITLGPAEGLDDRNPVVGKVVEGLDTVRELARTPTDEQRRPIRGAELDDVTRLPAPQQDVPPAELSAYGFDCVEAAEPGDTAEYLVAVRNTGQEVVNGTFSSSLDDVEGWDATVRNADKVVVSSGQTVTYALNVTVPEDAQTDSERSFNVSFKQQDSNVSAELELTTRVGELGERAIRQDRVEVRYVGVLSDGRAFDTTEKVYTEDASVNWFRPKPSEPEPVTLEISPHTLNASQPGKLVERARLGESVVGLISPGDAYGENSYGQNNLGGRLLVFQVQVTLAR